MNDSEDEVLDPLDSPVQVGQLLGRVERIMLLRREQTEILRKHWIAGEIPIDRLPCHDQCDGEIMLEIGSTTLRGMCPAHMQKGVCPLVTKMERQLRHRMKLAGFEARYHDADIEKIRCRESVEGYVLNLTQNLADGRGLILSGDVGVGKTMALAWLARQILVLDHGVWCVLMEDLLTGLADRNRRQSVVTRALSVEFLMFDDFGSGEIQAWMMGVLEGIVEKRYAAKKPTLLSTNMTREQLVHTVEFRRMVDRWRQVNAFVNIGGGSQRGDA